MKRSLILEISSSGHHPSYLRRILESGLLHAAHVIVAGPASLSAHPELSALLAQCEFHELAIDPDRQTRLADFSTLGLVRREFTLRAIYQRAWRRASSSGPVDLVLLPLVDGCANAIALRGGPFGATPWIAISMRAQFHLRKMGVTAPRTFTRAGRAFLFRRLLRTESLGSLLTIDPTLAEYAARQRGSEFAKIRLLPDTCNTCTLIEKSAARRQLGIPSSARLILAFGHLTARKGVLIAMRAMAREDCPKHVCLLLAGSQDNEVESFLAGPVAAQLLAEGRLHLRPGFVPEESVPTLLSAADAMWIGYTGFYTMSNMLVLAARHGLPILASNQGVIGWLASRHNLGLIVDPQSQDSVADALRKVADPPPSQPQQLASARDAFAHHTDAVFHRVIMQAIESALHGSISDR